MPHYAAFYLALRCCFHIACLEASGPQRVRHSGHQFDKICFICLSKHSSSLYKSKEEGKGQESINQVSHLTSDTIRESDKNTGIHDTQEIQEVKYVLKKVILWKHRMYQELKLECASFLARLASFGHLGLISDPLIIAKFTNETHEPFITSCCTLIKFTRL